MGRGVEGRPAGKPVRARDEQGQALVEFALTLPLLLLIVFGVISFGVLLNNDVTLQNAANASAQYLSTRRAASKDPCLDAAQTVFDLSPSLTFSEITFTINLSKSGATSGTTSTTTVTAAGAANAAGVSEPSCNGDQSDMGAGYPAQVILTYPCGLATFGFSLGTSCVLTAQATYDIQ